MRRLATDTFKNLAKDVNELGTIGSISYVAALTCFVFVIFGEKIITQKDWALVIMGVVLFGFSGVLYLRETILRAANRKEALRVLREVYNRLAEASPKPNSKEQTVSITMTIDNLPKQILKVLDQL